MPAGERRKELERWLVTIETNCTDPSREKECNEWYDGTHVPDVLSTPGMLRATRYENPTPGEGRGKYLALYEFDTEDLLQTMAVLNDNMCKWGEQGRLSPLLQIISGCFYRRMASPVIKRKRR